VTGKPPTVVDLAWGGPPSLDNSTPSFGEASPPSLDNSRPSVGEARALTFSVTTHQSSFILDGHAVAGPSPVEALAAALAGCMSIDVIDILTKGRHTVRALRAHLSAERAPSEPRRFVRASLHITIEGEVAASAVERAIALSREKYCSVWHSMRQDIELSTSYELRA